MTYTLTPFTPDSAGLVAGWSTSADEADMWCSRAEHPFPAEVVAGWATKPDVAAYLLLAEGEPVAYGEVWSDEDEDEAELARLIVAPAARGRGVGRALTAALVANAGYDNVFLRVRPTTRWRWRPIAARDSTTWPQSFRPSGTRHNRAHTPGCGTPALERRSGS